MTQRIEPIVRAPSEQPVPQPHPGENLITQAQLRRLRELQQLNHEYARLRQQVNEMWQRNRACEPGKLSLVVAEYVHRGFSFEKLSAILGDVQTQWLKDHIPPTKSLRLNVIETNSRNPSNPSVNT